MTIGLRSGAIDSSLDTAVLPEGYHNVRLWVTDWQNIAHQVVQYLKVRAKLHAASMFNPEAGIQVKFVLGR